MADHNDRDSRAMCHAARKGSGRHFVAARHAVFNPVRATDMRVMSGREDRFHSTRGAAPHIQPGFGSFRPTLDDVSAFLVVESGGWRVAVPPASAPAAVVRQIAAHGPAWAGYVRVGDTLVPAALGPGERALLAQAPATLRFIH